MKNRVVVSIAVLACLVFTGAALAGDKADTVTLKGNIICAKCSLKEEGRDKCQNVLVVEKDGKEQLYYLAMNDVNESFGDVCMAKKPVKVTGNVSEKDGKMWLAASNIEAVETKS